MIVVLTPPSDLCIYRSAFSLSGASSYHATNGIMPVTIFNFISPVFGQNVKTYDIIPGVRNVGTGKAGAIGADEDGKEALLTAENRTQRGGSVRSLHCHMSESLGFAKYFCHRWTRMDTDGIVLLICVYLRGSVAQFSWLRLAALRSSGSSWLKSSFRCGFGSDFGGILRPGSNHNYCYQLGQHGDSGDSGAAETGLTRRFEHIVAKSSQVPIHEPFTHKTGLLRSNPVKPGQTKNGGLTRVSPTDEMAKNRQSWRSCYFCEMKTGRFPSQPDLRMKIGQMLLAGFRGYEISDQHPIARDLTAGNLGGVILFDQEMAGPARTGRNIRSPGQVKRLVKSLQRRARIPLWIAIDQEGGRVNRLKPAYGFPATLSQQELGTINRPEQTFAHAEKIALTLREFGHQFQSGPGGGFGRRPGQSGYFRQGAELFGGPAHRGAARPGVCQGAPPAWNLGLRQTFSRPRQRARRHASGAGGCDAYWTEQELIPFRRLIQAGLCDAIMTAHVFNAHLDPARPATLSQPVLGGLLRRRLGFEGVILSDDMEMKAIADGYSLEQALLLGIQAGLDVFCFGNNLSFDPDIGARAAGMIRGLVEAGKISEARIDQSFRRVQKLKHQFKLI